MSKGDKSVPSLSHLDENGKANMVDVSAKDESQRIATAQACLSVSAELMRHIQDKRLPKGDIFSVARVAGIQGAKQCPNLIPLCHPLMLSKVQIDFEIDEANLQLRVICMCKLSGKTGVEMEALTGASVAALTLFDMCKAVDPAMVIHSVQVLDKQGGKTGKWERADD